MKYIGDDGRININEIHNITEAENLLAYWYNSWLWDDTMPGKMDGAVHIKTAIYFTVREIADAEHAD